IPVPQEGLCKDRPIGVKRMERHEGVAARLIAQGVVWEASNRLPPYPRRNELRAYAPTRDASGRPLRSPGVSGRPQLQETHMATNVILPALGMAQETGKVVRWLKTEGEQVIKGEPLAEIETDKATVELEAPASGMLANVTAASDEDIPVGQVIAMIMAPGEPPPPGAINRGPTTPAQSRAYESMPAEPPGARERTSTDWDAAPPTGPGRTHGPAAASPKAPRLTGEQINDTN